MLQASKIPVYAALLTPHRPGSLEADTATLFDYLDTVAEAAVDGLVLFGSTGEFVHFEIAERTRVAALAIKRSHVPVLVNVSHSSLAGAVCLAADAQEHGAAGLLLAPPYFYRYSDGQILAFYQCFLDQVGIEVPIYLYHLPSFTPPITLDTAKRLLSVGSYAGIKDSSSDMAALRALAALRQHQSFRLFLGSESLLPEAFEIGMDGIISGVAAAVPELMVALRDSSASDSSARVKVLSARLQEFLCYVDRFPATVLFRQAAVARGWPLEHSALPLDGNTAAALADFAQWFRAWWPQVLEECHPPA